MADRRAHMPEGTSVLLNTRSLPTAHRRLAELLQPGLTVLDVGCGTGAITSGIAQIVAPHGRVVGIDINPHLIVLL
ncbi:MAG: methyltransferase domain-containing protein [Deltaproteobacteria bacterium]|nr:methyltransferase domain-containing protein [Deltaproteobacteria bacterium]